MFLHSPWWKQQVLLDEQLGNAHVNPHYLAGLAASDMLIARMSSMKSSARAIRYIESSWQERLLHCLGAGGRR